MRQRTPTNSSWTSLSRLGSSCHLMTSMFPTGSAARVPNRGAWSRSLLLVTSERSCITHEGTKLSAEWDTTPCSQKTFWEARTLASVSHHRPSSSCSCVDSWRESSGCGLPTQQTAGSRSRWPRIKPQNSSTAWSKSRRWPGSSGFVMCWNHHAVTTRRPARAKGAAAEPAGSPSPPETGAREAAELTSADSPPAAPANYAPAGNRQNRASHRQSRQRRARVRWHHPSRGREETSGSPSRPLALASWRPPRTTETGPCDV